MGIDIEAFLECRWRGVDDPLRDPDKPLPDPNDPRWYTLAPFVSIDRNYHLFGLLADVHNTYNLPAIAPPRGLPPDSGWRTEEAWESQGGSDASFVRYAELQQVQQSYCTLQENWNEGRLVPRGQEMGPPWRVFARLRDVPEELFSRLFFPDAAPPGYAQDDLAIAVRHHEGPFRPHPDLAAILAYLRVYEEGGYETRMVFWFH